MKQVECLTLYGETILKPSDELVFRPSVYGLVISDGKLLVVNSRNAKKFHLPGGGIDLGEKIADALVREVKEETGIDVIVKDFFYFKEQFWYYNPSNESFHGILFFYFCEPTSFIFAPEAEILEMDEEAEKPEWLEIKSLNPANFMESMQEIIIKLIEKHDQI